MAKQSKSDKAKVSRAMREVFTDVPKTVKATGKTGEAKRKMQVAIGLSKARAAGARIPKAHEGGVVPESGVYELEKGEIVVHPGQVKRKLPKSIPAKEFSEVKDMPSMQRGGVVPSTGIYNMHRGERVIPAPKVSAVGGQAGSRQMLPASGAFGTFAGTPPPGTLGGMPTMPTT